MRAEKTRFRRPEKVLGEVWGNALGGLKAGAVFTGLLKSACPFFVSFPSDAKRVLLSPTERDIPNSTLLRHAV